MKVSLTRRWGPYCDGKDVEISETQGRWLVQHGYGTAAGVEGPDQSAAAEGGHGADPLAGADGSRRRPMTINSNRDKSEGQLHAAEGSSPAYRGGFTAEDAQRQGEAGRNYREGADERSKQDEAAEGSPARSRQRARAGEHRSEDQATDGAGVALDRSAAQNDEKPRRTRKSNGA